MGRVDHVEVVGLGIGEYLDAGARDYVNDPRGAKIRDGRLYVSSIYHWFEEDFAADGGVIAVARLSLPSRAQ